MLNIVIDVTPISQQNTGVGFFVSSLVKELRAMQEDHGFNLNLVYQPGLQEWLHLRPCQLKLHPKYKVKILRFPVRISNILLAISPGLLSQEIHDFCDGEYVNLYHGTNYETRPYSNFKRVISIYDLSFVKYPQFTNQTVSQYYRKLCRCLEWTDLVITISENSKKDIVEILKVDPERVKVTYLASRFSGSEPQKNSSPAIDKLKPYLLFVGTIEPRKNIETIIHAFNYLKKQYRLIHQLVLVGRKGWKYDSIFDLIKQADASTSIYYFDYVEDLELASLYRESEILLYPSWYEGFGLPILEAMTFQTPVIASNTSSIPEVAGDAALLIDPNNPQELVEAILSILEDEYLREELIARGRAQTQKFSWSHTARQVLDAYKTLL